MAWPHSPPAKVQYGIRKGTTLGECGMNELPEPGRTLMTPGGSPAFAASSANFKAVSGDTWAGLMTTVLPAARQGAIFHDSIISG